jgi:hypothetical protein
MDKLRGKRRPARVQSLTVEVLKGLRGQILALRTEIRRAREATRTEKLRVDSVESQLAAMALQVAHLVRMMTRTSHSSQQGLSDQSLRIDVLVTRRDEFESRINALERQLEHGGKGGEVQ